MKLRVYVGTYTLQSYLGPGSGEPGRGIHILELDTEALHLKEILPPEETPNPSFLALHPGKNVLYAVHELGESGGRPGGGVSAFQVRRDGSLRLLGTASSGGEDPCHLSLSPDGRYLALANYSGGSVGVFALGEDGSITRRTALVRHAGSGPDPVRQRGPHAHAAVFDPRGRFLLAADLGSDRLAAYGVDPQSGALFPAPVPFFACRPGTGPRSGAFHPSLPVFYLSNELENSVSVFAYDPDTAGLREVQTLSALAPGSVGPDTCAHVQVSEDGGFVYVSNRGQDSLAVFRAERKTGRLQSLGAVWAGGRTPRHFALFDGFLLAGCQDSGLLMLFRPDAETGMPKPLSQLAVPAPVCVLAAGRAEA